MPETTKPEATHGADALREQVRAHDAAAASVVALGGQGSCGATGCQPAGADASAPGAAGTWT